MKIDMTATGKTVSEALENAKKELGVDILDGLEFEVLEQPKKGGFLGLKALPAKVRVYSAEEEAPKPEKKPEAKREERKPEEKKPDAGKPTPKYSALKPNEDAPVSDRAQKPNNGERRENRPNNNNNGNNNNKRREGNRQKSQKRPMPEPKPMLALDSTAEELQNDPALLFVRKLISDLEINARAEMYIDDENMRRVLIYGDEACSLIGHHGETLDAFQYLANLAVIRRRKEAAKEGASESKARVTIDIENYRAKREETLRALARRMANKALKYKRSVMLEPMNPYERRIIHSEIQNIAGVSTNSVGAENNRKIVIYLTDEKKPATVVTDTDNTEEE